MVIFSSGPVLAQFIYQDVDFGDESTNGGSATIGVVAADGWYEWARDGDTKQPWFFQLVGGAPFAFAGLWTPPRAPGGLPTFAILTTGPSTLCEKIHHRMPVVLRDRDWAEWLDEHPQGPGRLQFLCRTWEVPLEAWPVSTAVNRPQFDEPACIAPLA